MDDWFMANVTAFMFWQIPLSLALPRMTEH